VMVYDNAPTFSIVFSSKWNEYGVDDYLSRDISAALSVATVHLGRIWTTENGK
jgi:hypothetical protein